MTSAFRKPRALVVAQKTRDLDPIEDHYFCFEF